MKRAFVAAVLAASLICLVALAAAAASPQQWSRQPENGFRTFDVGPGSGQAQVLQGEAVQGVMGAPSPTQTPDPTATPTIDPTATPFVPGGELGRQVVSIATPTPIPAPVRAPAPTPRPVVVAVPTVAQAKAYALSVIGSTQYSCLLPLWQHESGWNTFATNVRSGAYGIPQALPGYKMATAGADWHYNPVTQVKWGLGYVSSRYGSACGAWSFWQSHGWY